MTLEDQTPGEGEAHRSVVIHGLERTDGRNQNPPVNVAD